MAGTQADEDLTAKPEKAINEETLDRLKRDAWRCTRAGRWLFGIAIVIGLVLVWASYQLTGVYVRDLEDANNPPLMLILLLVRGALFGGLAVGFLYGIFTVGNAYIDQATRFRKRLYSAHMLNYAFDTFTQEIKEGKVTVDDVVRLFYAWNANVDSAFSRVAFQRASKNLIIGNGRLSVEEPSEQGRSGTEASRHLGDLLRDAAFPEPFQREPPMPGEHPAAD